MRINQARTAEYKKIKRSYPCHLHLRNIPRHISLKAHHHYWSHFSPQEEKEWNVQIRAPYLKTRVELQILKIQFTVQWPYSLGFPSQHLTTLVHIIWGKRNMIRIHSLRRISAENLRMKSIIFTQREEKFLIKLFCFCFLVICVFVYQNCCLNLTKDWSFHNYARRINVLKISFSLKILH